MRSFQRYYNYFHRILAAIYSFNGTVHCSDVKISSHPVVNASYRETNLLLKQLLFREEIFFRKLSYLGQFLVTNTFSDQLLHKINTFSEQLLFRRSNTSFRISNYSEHVFFLSRYYFRAATFSEEELFQEQVFLETVTFSEELVLRNQLHSIYT